MLLTTVEQSARLNVRQWRRERASYKQHFRLPIVVGTTPGLFEAVGSFPSWRMLRIAGPPLSPAFTRTLIRLLDTKTHG